MAFALPFLLANSACAWLVYGTLLLNKWLLGMLCACSVPGSSNCCTACVLACRYGGVVYRENVALKSDWYVFSIPDITAALKETAAVKQ